MLKRYLISSLFAAFFIFLVNCSSFKKKLFNFYVQSSKDTKAMHVSFKAPPPSYQKKAHKTLDAVWTDEQKGSSISYFSSCSKVSQSLEVFQVSSYPRRLNYKMIQRVKKPDSLYSVLEISHSKDDKSYVAVYTMSQMDCFFNLNLTVPSKELFNQEEPVFKKFIQKFNL